MNETKKTLSVTPRWAITVVVGAVLTGMVTGAFGILNVVNSDHFTLMAVTDKVAKLEETRVDREFYDVHYISLCEKIENLGKKVENLTTAVNALYRR